MKFPNIPNEGGASYEEVELKKGVDYGHRSVVRICSKDEILDVKKAGTFLVMGLL